MHLHADDFWHHVVVGYQQPWLPAAAHQNEAVMRAVLAAMASFWSDGYAVVVDGVIGPWFLDSLRAAGPGRIEVDYVILLPSLAVSLARVRTRTDHEMKDLAATEHMHNEFSCWLPEYERHVIDTSDMTPTEVVDEVVERRAQDVYRLLRT